MYSVYKIVTTTAKSVLITTASRILSFTSEPINNLFDRNALIQTRWSWFVFLIVEEFNYVRLSSIMFDCWTVRSPNVRLRSIGQIFLWVFLLSSIKLARLPNVRLTTFYSFRTVSYHGTRTAHIRNFISVVKIDECGPCNRHTKQSREQKTIAVPIRGRYQEKMRWDHGLLEVHTTRVFFKAYSFEANISVGFHNNLKNTFLQALHSTMLHSMSMSWLLLKLNSSQSNTGCTLS